MAGIQFHSAYETVQLPSFFCLWSSVLLIADMVGLAAKLFQYFSSNCRSASIGANIYETGKWQGCYRDVSTSVYSGEFEEEMWFIIQSGNLWAIHISHMQLNIVGIN